MQFIKFFRITDFCLITQAILSHQFSNCKFYGVVFYNLCGSMKKAVPQVQIFQTILSHSMAP